ncbi:MAG TPA: hypothetical protein PKC77_05505 [Sphingopyxis sp.]|nr:hypothetical protein [Sphingopyxis sp.]
MLISRDLATPQPTGSHEVPPHRAAFSLHEGSMAQRSSFSVFIRPELEDSSGAFAEFNSLGDTGITLILRNSILD